MKKFVSMLIAAMTMCALLVGCGASFDATGYVKALLDNSYKNDSTEFVNQKLGTAEDAAKIFEEGIDAEMSMFSEGVEMSDELTAEFRTIITDILSKANYEVTGAEQQSDKSYVVTVKYQPLQVFGPAMESFTAASEAYIAEITEKATNGEETPSEEQLQEEVFTLLKDCLAESVTTATYGDEAETTITLKLEDNVYSPVESDLENLEMVLFDTEAMQ